MAELHGSQYVQEFSRKIYQQLGMHVLVLVSHVNTRGTTCMARWALDCISGFPIDIGLNSHDFNDKLGGQSLAEIWEYWEEEPIMTEWTKYAQSQMGE